MHGDPARFSLLRACLVAAVLGAIGASATLLSSACGSGAPPAGGTDSIPNSHAGPFRVLKAGELRLGPPFIVGSSTRARSPAMIDLDGDPSTFALALFAAEGEDGFPAKLTRRELPDGRTPDLVKTTVLEVSETWEDTAAGLDAPAPFLVGTTWWLFYSSGGCIGRARSDDGLVFTKEKEPVLCANDTAGAWDAHPVSSPSIHVGFEGRVHLLYGADGSIGEAISTSVDGAFTRVGAAPVLSPSRPDLASEFDGGVDGGLEAPFDAVWVGDPFAMTTTNTRGASITLVYYSGVSQIGVHAVGLAGRFGDLGGLEKNEIPALARYEVRAPSVVRFPAFDLLMATGANKEGKPGAPLTIIGAIAPAAAGWPYVRDAGVDAESD